MTGAVAAGWRCLWPGGEGKREVLLMFYVQVAAVQHTKDSVCVGGGGGGSAT